MPKKSRRSSAFAVIPANRLKLPPGGKFRVETVRDRKVIDHIENNPGFTAAEYGDRLGVIAADVNDILLSTRQGRQLAERGKVRLPARGRAPHWAKLCHNRKRFVKKVRTNQFATPVLDGFDSFPDVLGVGLSQLSMARHLALRSTPKGRKAAIDAIDANTTKQMQTQVELIQQSAVMLSQIASQTQAVLKNLSATGIIALPAPTAGTTAIAKKA